MRAWLSPTERVSPDSREAWRDRRKPQEKPSGQDCVGGLLPPLPVPALGFPQPSPGDTDTCEDRGWWEAPAPPRRLPCSMHPTAHPPLGSIWAPGTTAEPWAPMSSKPAAQLDLVPATARPPEGSSAACVALPLPPRAPHPALTGPKGGRGQVWVSLGESCLLTYTGRGAGGEGTRAPVLCDPGTPLPALPAEGRGAPAESSG